MRINIVHLIILHGNLNPTRNSITENAWMPKKIELGLFTAHGEKIGEFQCYKDRNIKSRNIMI